MTELELEHLRREKWRLEGEPVRTLEEARDFVGSAGLCLMYPVKPKLTLPTFVGASIGTDRNLPTRAMAFSDPRTRPAEELLTRLVSDRKPRQPIVSRARGKASPLTEHVFRQLEESGPLNRRQLQDKLGGALSESGIDRALLE